MYEKIKTLIEKFEEFGSNAEKKIADAKDIGDREKYIAQAVMCTVFTSALDNLLITIIEEEGE